MSCPQNGDHIVAMDAVTVWLCRVLRGMRAGLINVIYAGIIANAVRFIYIAYLQSPWWILPFECIQGETLHHHHRHHHHHIYSPLSNQFIRHIITRGSSTLPEKPYGSLDWPPIKDKYKSGIKPAGVICRTVVLAFL